ncbi:MAG: hypothetical protein DRI01_08490 [Chloroflexi bacterium]|nr:MAG: hypothetical protein DRI01_08490 [Chloroflexota bacterium]
MKDRVSFLKTKYRLKKDPFDSRVDLTAPMADRKEEQRRWTEVIERRKGLSGNSLNFIVGDYGLGKSYTLYQIGEQFRGDRQILPLYLKFLPEDTVQRFGLDFITRIFRTLRPDIILRRLPKDSFDKLGLLSPDAATVLQKYFHRDELAEAFLKGDRPLTLSELKGLGARRKLVSTEVAKDYLLALLYLLRRARILTLLLLVDEVEYVFSQMTGAKVANVFNTLRDLYDLPQSPKALGFGQPLANMIFFFGISGAGWVRLNDLERREQRRGGPFQPFLDRKEEVIELQPLSHEETRQLIELRLRRDRVRGILLDKPLIPYTGDYVEYIYQLTRGNPRHVVERCDLVLLDGLRDAVPELNKSYARQVLESHGLPVEPS